VMCAQVGVFVRDMVACCLLLACALCLLCFCSCVFACSKC
jgi:hypothetical protein